MPLQKHLCVTFAVSTRQLTS